MVAFSDRLFLEEELADTAVTANMLSADSYWKWGCGNGDALSHSEQVCLLYPAGARRLKGGTVAIALDSRRLDHWRTVVWDPGIVGFTGLISML